MGLTPRYLAISSVAAGGAVEIGPNTRPGVTLAISATSTSPVSTGGSTGTGATLSQTVTGTSPQTLTVSAAGTVKVGDTVYHDIAVEGMVAGNEYTVTAIGGGSISLSWASGSRTLTTGKVLTIGDHGDLVVGDIVYHDIVATAPAAATQYTVSAITGGRITLTFTGGGSRTVTAAKILSPGKHSNGVVTLLGYSLNSPTAAASAQFLSGLTALTGAETNLVHEPVTSEAMDMPVARTNGNETMYLAAVTGALNGWAVYSYS